MKITVIGAGAIGLLYASRLALSGEQVRALTRTAGQAALLRSPGISLRTSAEEHRIPLEAATLEEAALDRRNTAEAQWILLSVKQTSIDEPFLSLLAAVAKPGDGILCLQNGIGHIDKLEAAVPGIALYAGVTSEGALREGASTVIHTGAGQLHYGAANAAASEPASQRLRQLWQLAAEKAGIPAFLSNDMSNRIYHKLLLNAAINPLTALYGIANGELPDHPQAGRLMTELHEETLAILAAAGMQVTGSEHEQLLEVCRLTSRNVSSMRADIAAGRRSEIGSINGAIAALASRLGLPAPLNEAATAMVKALEP